MKVIIPAAGWGTRFLPATKAQPKEMLPVVDKPVIQYIVEELAAAGLKDIIFVTGRNKRSLEDHFDNHGELEAVLARNGKDELLKNIQSITNLARFTFVRQNEALGNGDAVKKALHLVGNEPAAVTWGDDIFIDRPPLFKTLLELFAKLNAPLLSIRKAPLSQISRYGVVGVEKTKYPGVYRITDIVEKPSRDKAPSRFTSIGQFILTPAVYPCLDELYPPEPNKEIYLTDALKVFLNRGGELYGYEFQGERYDCGSKIGFLQAQVAFGLTHPETKREFRKYLKRLSSRL